MKTGWYITIVFLLLPIPIIYFLSKVNNEVVCNPDFRVLDGDTFYISNVKYRIFGIDALELNEQKDYVLKKVSNNTTCLKFYAELAKKFLEEELSKGCVKIENKMVDKYNRILAKVYICNNNTCYDIGKYMVEQGLALSFLEYYKEEEELARSNNIGLWSCKS